MKTYLFELGTEEIPASMIQTGIEQMAQCFRQNLSEAGIDVPTIRKLSTPRRLALILEGLPERQPDREEVLSGPPRSAAFDSDGRPAPAAEGFARKMGVSVEDLEVASTDRGEYLVVRRVAAGKPLDEILSETVPLVLQNLTWPKNMYWTSSRFRFIRPLRWFVSLLETEVVPFEFEGVQAGRVSRGHRSLGETQIDINSADTYLDQLRENFVLADRKEREDRIRSGLQSCLDQGLELVEDSELFETVVELNEYPTVLVGRFDEQFLEIPREVLVTVMRFHQKYFPVTNSDASLAPVFVTVINTDGDPEGQIRQGHEKVLKARLEDADFFWKTDQEKTLAERYDLLHHVLYQEELGSYADKTDRIRAFLKRLGADAALDEAARLCKVDLTTEMVRELPELQGIIGGLYAKNQGLEAWQAIYEHYRPVSLDDEGPDSEAGALLSIADRMDSIAGCFRVGIVPSGSSDPFALRRQGQGAIRILLDHGLAYGLHDLIQWALEGYDAGGPSQKVRSRLHRFMVARLRYVLHRQGLAADVVNAVLAVPASTVSDVWRRAEAVARIKGQEDFEALAVAFKRVKNILEKQAEQDSVYEASSTGVDPDQLVEAEERKLFEAFEKVAPDIRAARQDGNYGPALKAMAALRTTVDSFFDAVMVMTEDDALRKNRIALLRKMADSFLQIADISEIVQ